MRTRRPKRSNAFIGLMAVIVIAVAIFFGFTKDIPFTHGYVLKAQFESANSIRPNSPVRIAGVDVGKVKKIEPLQGTNAAVLVMELKHSALPIHQDATAKIRPRIFLEGNFFVDLKPGTPQSPQLDSGDTLRISQTATPVQLDQVLTSLQSDSRQDLKIVLRGFNQALNVLNPTLAYLTPAQTQCNYITLFFRNVASHLSEGDRNGTWQRFIIVTTPQGPNAEGGPSSAPANGPTADNHVHLNPYPNTRAPGQPAECEAGNEPYASGKTVLSNIPGTQSGRTEPTN